MNNKMGALGYCGGVVALHLVLRIDRCKRYAILQDFGSRGGKPPRYAIYFEMSSETAKTSALGMTE